MKLNTIDLGRIDYMEALNIQNKLHEMRCNNEIDDTFLILEHFPVFTLGCRGKTDNIYISENEMKKRGIDVYKVNRGGDVTYHGPGQIVGYPILDLTQHDKSIKKYIWRIEELFMHLLKNEYNIEAHREEKKYTGIWVDNNKIAAIGIGIKRSVTMHGFAFNVNTDLEYFKLINPCGLTDRGVTSIKNILGTEIDYNDITKQVIDYFLEVFQMEQVSIGIDELIKQ